MLIMPFRLLLCLAAALFAAALRAAEPAKAPPPAAAQPPAESKAQTELKALVARQQALLAQADQAEKQIEVEDMRPQFQKLVNDYEKYVKDYPEVAAGYVSYALLLGKPLLDERKSATALLLKANQLDPNLPLVKNQLGNYLAEEGKPLEAVNYYLSAIQLAPDEPLYHYQLGTLLSEARDDFLKSGDWKRPALDTAMQHAFAEAARLAPANIGFAYRHAESYYELDQPDWPAALQAWRALEGRMTTKREKQTIQLHEANVLLKMKDVAAARALIAAVDDPILDKQRQKLVDQLPGGPATPPDAPPGFPVPAAKVVP